MSLKAAQEAFKSDFLHIKYIALNGCDDSM